MSLSQNSVSRKSQSILLASGGPDSSTLAKWAKANGHDNIQPLYFRLGQVEDEQAIRSASLVSDEIGTSLQTIDITQPNQVLGKMGIGSGKDRPILPFGNAIALSIAISYAKAINANKILIGILRDDAQDSVECQRPFIDSIQALAQSTLGDIEILTPFIDLSKSQVFAIGAELGVDFEKTWSCVRAGDMPCGCCKECYSREKALGTLGKQAGTI